ESQGYVRVSAPGDLVGAVQQARPEVAVGRDVVGRSHDEVLIAVAGCSRQLGAPGVLEPREAVGELEVDCLDSVEWCVAVRGEFERQSVLDGPPDRRTEECRVRAAIDAAKRAGMAQAAQRNRLAAAYPGNIVRSSQAKTGIINNGSACHNGAIHA